MEEIKCDVCKNESDYEVEAQGKDDENKDIGKPKTMHLCESCFTNKFLLGEE